MANEKNFLYNIVVNVKNSANKGIKDLGGNLKQMRSNIGQAIDDLDIIPNSFKNVAKTGSTLTAGLSKGFIAAGGAITAAVAAVVAFGAASWEAYKAQRALNKELSQLGRQFKDLDTTSLVEANARIKAIGETFSAESKDIINAAKAMSVNLGTTLPEALALIEDGFIRGADSQNEYLDSIKEYTSALKNAGFSAEQFNKILIEAGTSGQMTDKLPDALKSFNEKLKEQSKATVDALKPLGAEFTNTLLKGIKDGTVSTADAIGILSKKFQTVTLDAKEMNAVSSGLFESLGLDAGGATEVLKILNKGLNGTQDALTDLQKAEKNQMQATAEATEAWDKLIKSMDVGFVGKMMLGFTELKVTIFDTGRAILGMENSWITLLKVMNPATLVSGIKDIKNAFDKLKIEDAAKKTGSLVSTAISSTKPGESASTGTSKKSAEEIKLLNAHRAKLATIYAGMTSDAISEKLKQLDIERSIEDTKLEDLEARKKKELDLIKQSYAAQINEANIAAEEMLRNAAGKEWGESFSKAERATAMAGIKTKAAGGGAESEEARRQLETINQAYAESASLRKQQETEIAALKKKYADEEFSKQQELKELYRSINMLRLDQETLRLKQSIKLTTTLEGQLVITNQLYEVERRRLEQDRQARIETLRAAARASGAGGTNFQSYDDEKDRIEALIKKQEELKAANEKMIVAQEALDSAHRRGLRQGNADWDRAAAERNRVAAELQQTYARLGEPFNTAASVTNGWRVEAQRAIATINQELARLNGDLRQLTTATLQQIANDAATFGATMAAEAQQILASNTQQDAEIQQTYYNQQLDIYRNFLQQRSDLIQQQITREEAWFDGVEEKQKGLRAEREKAIKANAEANLKAFNFKGLLTDVKSFLQQGFITEKAIMQERIDHLEEIRKYQIELAKEQAQDQLISNFTDSGLDLEAAKQRTEQLMSLGRQYGNDRAKLEQEMGRKLSDQEMARVIELNNRILAANKEFMDKKEEIFMSDTELRLDRTRRIFEQIAEVGQAYVDVIGSIFSVMDQYTQAEIDRLSATIEDLSTKLTAINELISESETKVNDLEDLVNSSRGKRRLDSITLYDKEREKLMALKAEEYKLQTQRIAAENKQKELAAEQAKRAETLSALNQVVATTSMIAAAASALGEANRLPFPANLVAMAASMGALVSLFATAKSVFKFREGGQVLADGGMVKGKSHSEGGVPFSVKGSNAKYEMEGGEYVMSRKAVQRIGLDRLNEMNFNRKSLNGNKSVKYQVGGSVPGSTVDSSIDTSLVDRMDVLIGLNEAALSRPTYVAVTDINRETNDNRAMVNSSRF